MTVTITFIRPIFPIRPFAAPSCISCPRAGPPPSPKVHLVGCGPGAADLLTERAKTALQNAEVILHDRLIPSTILSLAPPHAEVRSVGKARGLNTGTQPDINSLLAHHALAGRRVVRLKAGDVGVFGRASEEIEHLTQLGVKVEIIPGVTSASAVAAELGFSLTRKGVADSVWFVTGHLGATCVKADMVGRVTIVIYMGLSELDGLLERLIAEGARRDVAAVAVQTIGLETEKIVWGNVSSLAQKVRKAELHSATLVVIGDVVKEGRGWNG